MRTREQLARAGIRVYAVLATAALLALAYRDAASADSVPDGEFRVREGERFRVPIGMVAVITRLDVDSISITDVGLGVDGQERLGVNPDRCRECTRVLATAGSLSEVRVYGGLIEEGDAFCSGYLLPESSVSTPCE